MVELTKEHLEKMKQLGFEIFGESFFKDTLTYVQIQRKLKELEEEAKWKEIPKSQ